MTTETKRFIADGIGALCIRALMFALPIIAALR